MADISRRLERALYLRANAGIIPVIIESSRPREIFEQFRGLSQQVLARINSIASMLPSAQLINQLLSGRTLRAADFLPIRLFDRLNMVALPVTSDLLEDLIQRRDVKKIYEDKIVQALQLPKVESNGIYASRMRNREYLYTSTYWTSRLMGAHKAHDMNIRGEGVRVAVIDTTALPVHQSIAGAIWDTAFPGIYTDANGHGVWCAAAVAGKPLTINGIPTMGVAPNATLITIKALGFIMGFGTDSSVIDSITRAVFTHRAKIVSMSLGSSDAPENPQDDAEVRAIELLSERGVVFCVAAGNDGTQVAINSPGIAESAITVGAYNPINGQLAPFSSLGPTKDGRIKPDVTAPGQDIFAPTVGILDYTSKPIPQMRGSALSGTSMATPHVAGLAALIVQHAASLGRDVNAKTIKEMMKNFGEFPFEEKNTSFGWGVPTWDKWIQYVNQS